MRFMSTLFATCALLLQFASPMVQAQSDANNGTTNEVMSRYFAQSEQSKQVGEAYFNAYVNLDWDKVESLLALQSNFSDPTARLVFGNVNVSGKAAIMEYFRTAYKGLTMKFIPLRKVYSGHYAIFEGTLDWTYPGPNGPVRVIMPFTNILQIENGQVLKHTDYADYHPYFSKDA